MLLDLVLTTADAHAVEAALAANEPPLHLAARLGRLDLVERLLCDRTDRTGPAAGSGNTAFHALAAGAHLKSGPFEALFDSLRARGLDPSQLNHQGEAPDVTGLPRELRAAWEARLFHAELPAVAESPAGPVASPGRKARL